MTLREALAGIPDPRGKNRQFPLPGLLALILVAFLCRVDSLRGVARFARANPHLLPHLGLRRPPGHYAFTTLLHRLDPWDLQEALARVFPEVPVSPGEREVWVVDGKVLRGSRKGGFPQVRLVEVLALGLRRTLVQARAEGREARAKRATPPQGVHAAEKGHQEQGQKAREGELPVLAPRVRNASQRFA